MLAFSFLLALAATTSAAHIGLLMTENSPLFSNRIVGGEAYDISRVPYQGSLQVGSSQSVFCGCSIINARFILTASHCIVGNEAYWNDIFVRVGSSLKNQGGQFIKVKNFYPHPYYNKENNWVNDIAILELSTPIELNSTAQPVGLPSLGAALPIGENATTSGWGRLTSGGISPTQLQGVQMPIQDPSVCENAYGNNAFYRDVMVCAGSLAGGHSSCQGDSGGPLVYSGTQYGIVSWALGCAQPDYPTVFSHVANLRQFITSIVGI